MNVFLNQISEFIKHQIRNTLSLFKMLFTVNKFSTLFYWLVLAILINLNLFNDQALVVTIIGLKVFLYKKQHSTVGR